MTSSETFLTVVLAIVFLNNIGVCNASLNPQHDAVKQSLQLCLTHIADLVHPPSFAAEPLKASAVKPNDFVSWDDAWAKRRPTYAAPKSYDAWSPGEPDAAGLRDAPFWRFPNSSVPLSDTQRKCREWLRGFGDRQQVLRDVFGVSKLMVRLGTGGTDGNIDVGSTRYLEPPVHQNSVRVTETVAVHFGPSLARSAFILAANLVMGPFVRPGWEAFVPLPVNKAKSVMERSASFYDNVTRHTHIVRVRWMANLYMFTFNTHFDAYVAPLFRPQRTSLETETIDDSGRVSTATQRFSIDNVTLAYLVMNGGEWDMQFMAGKKIPGMILENGERRNVTAGAAYWTAYSAKAGARVQAFVDGWASSGFAAPVIWKEQPLPRCSSHRYAPAKKAHIKCPTVLRPIVVPTFRRIAAAAFTNSSVVMPMDFLVEPNLPPHESSIGVAAAMGPPPWYNASEEHPMCWLGDGIHLPFECTWLELQVIWATAVAWRNLFASKEPALHDVTEAPTATSRVAVAVDQGDASRRPPAVPATDAEVKPPHHEHVVGGTPRASYLGKWRTWLPADMTMPAALMLTLWVATLMIRRRTSALQQRRQQQQQQQQQQQPHQQRTHHVSSAPEGLLVVIEDA